jgi:hypothetical protein
MARFTNREDLDFDNIEDHKPIQEWELVRDSNEVIEYSTRLPWRLPPSILT